MGQISKKNKIIKKQINLENWGQGNDVWIKFVSISQEVRKLED
jgi:hypothetical protein